MLTALVLVCSLASTPDAVSCDRTNAVDVVVVPDEFQSPLACLLSGQEYVATNSLGRELSAGEFLKIACIHARRAEAGK